MRRYRGNVTLELEDVNTGTVETVSETNMVTNTVNDLLGMNSKKSGANHYGSDAEVNTTLLELRKNSLNLAVAWLNTLFRTVEVDFENGLLYSIAYASNAVTVTKYRIPVFDVGLNEKLDDTTLTLLDTEVLQCSTFHFYGSYTPSGIFLDGGDGYWYGFANSPTSSGDATMLWIMIKKDDMTFTEGSWTLSNAALKAVRSFREDASYPATQRNAVLRGGYLYVLGYDNACVYKINISNPTDVTKLNLGFTSETKSICGSGSCEVRLMLLGDVIIGYDFVIDGSDNVIQTLGGIRTGSLATPLFQYKEFLVGWGGSYGNEYRYPDFIADKAGYGLAQWTFWSRKQALLDFAKARDVSIANLKMQLDFIWKELNDSHPAVLVVLKEAQSVREASDAVLLWYEKPADQSEKVQVQREKYGKGYYEKYAGVTSGTAGEAEKSSKSSSSGMSNTDCPFLVKVTAKDLRIGKGAGTDTAWTGKYVPPGVYTIVEVKEGKGSDAGWGRLKSGAGWIALELVKRV